MKMMKQSLTLFEFVLVVIALNGKLMYRRLIELFSNQIQFIRSFVRSFRNQFIRSIAFILSLPVT